MSETNMPLKVVASCPPVIFVTAHVSKAQPTSAEREKAYVTHRRRSARNRSITRIAHAAASRKISGYASSMMGRPVIILSRLSQLAHRQVPEEVVHRGVH